MTTYGLILLASMHIQAISISVVTWLWNLPKLAFWCVRSSKILEISLVDPNSSKIRVSIGWKIIEERPNGRKFTSHRPVMHFPRAWKVFTCAIHTRIPHSLGRVITLAMWHVSSSDWRIWLRPYEFDPWSAQISFHFSYVDTWHT